MEAIQTQHLAHEQAFAEWQQANPHKYLSPHAREVCILASKQTGLPLDMILDDSMRSDVVYARHLISWAMHRLLGHSLTEIQRMLGIARSSQYTGIQRINEMQGGTVGIDKAEMEKMISARGGRA